MRNDASSSVTGRARLDQVLARTRVPAGFVCAAVVLWLAAPTFDSLISGGLIAVVGESIRVWAAGHLEKGLEVTRSGPYRLTKHPLYVGSALIGGGIAIATHRLAAAVITVGYLALMLSSAIRHEEASMRAKFGDEYDAYLASRAQPVERPFALERALRNKEHHTIAGLFVVAVIFALKAARHL